MLVYTLTSAEAYLCHKEAGEREKKLKPARISLEEGGGGTGGRLCGIDSGHKRLLRS